MYLLYKKCVEEDVDTEINVPVGKIGTLQLGGGKVYFA